MVGISRGVVVTQSVLLAICLKACSLEAREQYVMDSGIAICIPDAGVTVISASVSDKNAGRFKHLLIDIEGMPLDVSQSIQGDVETVRTKSVTVEGVSPSDLEGAKVYEEVFKDAILYPEKITFDETFQAYKLKVDGAVGDSFRILKVNPNDVPNKVQPKFLSDWYLAFCSDGFGGEGTCFFNYPVNNVVISFRLKRSFMKDWRRIVDSVNFRMSSITCEIKP